MAGSERPAQILVPVCRPFRKVRSPHPLTGAVLAAEPGNNLRMRHGQLTINLYIIQLVRHRIAGELGAPLDKEFFAQDLPKFTPNVETASELISEAV
jgi:hypothetical protein